MCSTAPPPNGGCAIISRSPPWTASARCRGWKPPPRPLPSPTSTAPKSASVRRCRRLRAQRLAAPLTDSAAIARRLDAIATFVADTAVRDDIRTTLRAAPDMSRALARLSVGRGGPRDLAGLRDGILAADSALARLEELEEPPPDIG